MAAPRPPPAPRARTKWRPRSWEEAVEAAEVELAIPVLSYGDLFERARRLQGRVADERTCAERRAARVPPEARRLFAEAAAQGVEAERRRKREEARRVLRKHVEKMRLGRLDRNVRAGGGAA